MNKTLLLSFTFSGIIVFACTSKEDSKLPSAEESAASSSTEESAITPAGKGTHITWDGVGMRPEPTEKSKSAVSLRFGERIELTGDTAYDATAKKSFVQAKLSDGQTGWVRKENIAENSTIGAILELSSLYDRPDISVATTKTIPAGTMVIVTEQKNEFSHVMSENDAGKQRLKGWVLGTAAVSTDPRDVTAARLWKASLKSTDLSQRLQLLYKAIHDPSAYGSGLTQYMNHEYDSLSEVLTARETATDADISASGIDMEVIGSNVNMRSAPSVSGSTVVAQVSSPVICQVIEVGELETIDGTTDNWYKVKCGTSTGWIFGKFLSTIGE